MSTIPDPIFPAIQRVAAAHRAWSSATAAADAITTKLQALKAEGRPFISVDFAGSTIELRSCKAIVRLFRRARDMQNGASADLDATEARLLDAFQGERERIAAERERLGIADAESQIAEALQGLLAAQLAAARTVPTSPEGLRALIEMAARLPVNDRNHLQAALASLRIAAAALLPEGAR